MTLYELEGRVEKPKRKTFKGHDGFTCRCPSCAPRGDDRSGTNGYAYEKDDWLHVGCQKGCSEAEFLGVLGLTDDDRRIVPLDPDAKPPSPKPRGEVYPYTLVNGRVVFNKERYYVFDKDKPEKGWQKRFSQKTPSGADISTLGSKADILYNLPGISKAKAEGLTVYVNEGEKAAEAFKARGLVGTCTNNGAASGSNLAGKWKPAHTKQLAGVRHVVIVADRDTLDEKTGRIVGEDFAAFVAEQLWDLVDVVEVVQSKTTGHKDDAYDHFGAGFGVSDFVPRKDLLPPDDGLQAVQFDPETFSPVIAEWLFDDYLLKSKMTLLDGDGSTGKSTLAVAWAAAATRGVHPLTFKPLAAPINVLYLHKGEDQDDELMTVFRENLPPVLRMDKAVWSRIFWMSDEEMTLDQNDRAKLRRFVKRNRIGLIIIDPLLYFLGLKGDINSASDMSPVLTAFNNLAAEEGVTFLNIRHTKKLGGEKFAKDAVASEAGLGSVAIRNAHRGQIVLRKHPTKPLVSVATCERGSLLSVPGDPFIFRKVGSEVQYLQNEENPFDRTPAGDRLSQKQTAKDAIRSLLGNGAEVPAKQLEQAMADLSVSYGTYRNARKELGAEHRTIATQEGNVTVWFLPGAKPFVDPFEDE